MVWKPSECTVLLISNKSINCCKGKKSSGNTSGLDENILEKG